MRRLAPLPLLPPVLLPLALLSCRAPTQVTVELTTDAECLDLDEVQIATGSLGGFEDLPPSATTENCTTREGETHRIGSLVLVPQSDKSRTFAIQVVAGVGQSTQACIANGFVGGCIVARRSLGFQPKTPLELPVKLEVSCIDVPCGATETCSGGTCVSATIRNPEKCALPGGCDDQPVSGGSGGSGAETGVGGSASGGAASGGSASGGSASGGAGAGECGNGSLEFPEACDDNNTEDDDGCSSDCREEYLMGVEEPTARVMLLDRVTGDIEREFLIAPDMDAFVPLYVYQMPDRSILVTDISNGSLVRYDPRGNFVDKPVTGDGAIRQLGLQQGDVLQARGSEGIRAFAPDSFAALGPVASSDDAWALEVIDDKWFLSGGLSFGELTLFERFDNEGPYALYNGNGFFDLHVTSDRRLLIPDFTGTQTVELSPSVAPTDDDPLGTPNVTRAVNVPNSFSVFELPDGNWLLGSNEGLGVYNPDTRALLDSKTTDWYRDIEEYIGPLQNE